MLTFDKCSIIGVNLWFWYSANSPKRTRLYRTSSTKQLGNYKIRFVSYLCAKIAHFLIGGNKTCGQKTRLIGHNFQQSDRMF